MAASILDLPFCFKPVVFVSELHMWIFIVLLEYQTYAVLWSSFLKCLHNLCFFKTYIRDEPFDIQGEGVGSFLKK